MSEELKLLHAKYNLLREEFFKVSPSSRFYNIEEGDFVQNVMVLATRHTVLPQHGEAVLADKL